MVALCLFVLLLVQALFDVRWEEAAHNGVAPDGRRHDESLATLDHAIVRDEQQRGEEEDRQDGHRVHDRFASQVHILQFLGRVHGEVVLIEPAVERRPRVGVAGNRLLQVLSELGLHRHVIEGRLVHVAVAQVDGLVSHQHKGEALPEGALDDHMDARSIGG